jgi:adenylate cyclase
LSLRGKAEPVEVWSLRGLADVSRAAQHGEGSGLTGSLVGRQDELAQMVAAFDRTLGGRAQIVSLVGEAGTGKSRLVDELFAVLEKAGRLERVGVRRATCSSLGEQAYGVLRAFLREAYQLAPEDSLEGATEKLRAGLRALGSDDVEADRIAPILAHMLGIGSDETLRQIEPDQLRRQIFLAARLVIERRLQHGPLLFVVENLHWLTRPRSELLRFVADRLHDRPIMLLVTYRPGLDRRCSSTHVRLRRASA